MNRNIKKFIALAISITSVISAATALPAGAAEPKTTTGGSGTSIGYTGEAITPDILLYDDDIQLIEGQDYDLSYENNINVGTATIIVTFKGNYSGSTRTTFEITPRLVSTDELDITGIETEYTFTDAAIEPEPVIKLGDITLVKGQDYTLNYIDNTYPGEATVNITFIGNYSGEAIANFTITPKDLSSDKNLTASEIPAQSFTGEPIEPKPEIKYGDKTLTEGEDYTLEYENNTNAGEAKVEVKFTGDYTGEKEYTFRITPFIVTDDNVKLSEIPDQIYTGSAITPTVTVTIIRK